MQNSILATTLQQGAFFTVLQTTTNQSRGGRGGIQTKNIFLYIIFFQLFTIDNDCNQFLQRTVRRKWIDGVRLQECRMCKVQRGLSARFSCTPQMAFLFTNNELQAKLRSVII